MDVRYGVNAYGKTQINYCHPPTQIPLVDENVLTQNIDYYEHAKPFYHR